MSTVLQILAAHFAALGPRRVEIAGAGPDGAPLVLVARPLTLADHAALLAGARDEASYCAHVLVRGLRREDGTPAFTLDDVFALKTQLPAKILRQMVDFVLEEGPGDAELGERSPDPAGNSAAPSTASLRLRVPTPAPSSPTPPPDYCADGLPTLT